MTTIRTWLAAALVLATGGGLRGQELPAEKARQQQLIQQQVRTMARQLAASVIDVQLQQLRENGMGKDRWYTEIDGMRKHLDAMVAAEMPEVIALLSKVDQVGEKERQQVFAEARQKSRQILVRLIVERQTLMRRLRMAELVAQVEQLIVVQSKVRDATDALPEQPESRRPAMNQTAIEDQRDMRVTYQQFTAGLGDVSKWSGPFGEEALRGLKILDEQKVDARLISAEKQLQAAQFAAASADQKAVIEGLKAVLAELRQFQKLAERDAGHLAEKIKEALAKQEQIRKETEQAKPDSPEMRQLEDKQLEVRKEIAALEESATSPELKKTLETAKKSAEEARNELFKQQPEKAIPKQEEVVANLDKALKSAAENAPPADREKTAEEKKKETADLEAAAKDLKKAADDQANAEKAAEKSPAEGRTQEKQVAAELAKTPQNRDLPGEVKAAIQQAERAAQSAADAMKGDPQKRPAAEQKAERAIAAARAEAAKALTDAERKQLDEKIEKLSKAASELDKAAAAEKDVSKESQAAAEKQGVSPEQAKSLDEKHKGAEETAKQVGEEIKNEAPEAAKTIDEARQPLGEAGKRLATAKQQPGEPSKPAAAEAGKQAGEAAKLLEKAAEQLRAEMQEAEAELAKLPGVPVELAEAALRDMQRELGKPLDPLGQPVAQSEKAKAKPTHAPPRTKPEPPTPDSTQDAEAGKKQFLDQPWAAKLPPELRSAIRSNSHRRPPRGYEERLQRYYENMD